MKPALLPIVLLALAACTREQAPSAPAGDATAAAAQQPAATPPASAPAPAAPPATSLAVEPGALARTDGYGDMRFGMSADEARAAWPDGLKGDAVEPDNCAYLRPAPDVGFRVGFMFDQGTFARYDVAADDIAAPGGGRVGQSRADIERLYAGRLEVQPHHYVEGGNYLRVTDPAIAGGALLFETDAEGRITRWRVGRAPQVDYVEGCA